MTCVTTSCGAPTSSYMDFFWVLFSSNVLYYDLCNYFLWCTYFLMYTLTYIFVKSIWLPDRTVLTGHCNRSLNHVVGHVGEVFGFCPMTDRYIWLWVMAFRLVIASFTASSYRLRKWTVCRRQRPFWNLTKSNTLCLPAGKLMFTNSLSLEK